MIALLRTRHSGLYPIPCGGQKLFITDWRNRARRPVAAPARLPGPLRVDVQVQDASQGVTIASVTETADEEQIINLVSRLGDELRVKCGAGELTGEQAESLRVARPNSPEASRLFADGLNKLRLYEQSQLGSCCRKRRKPTRVTLLRTRRFPLRGPSLGMTRNRRRKQRKLSTCP